MMTYERGDVVLALFPNSDQSTYKTRPVIVVQDTKIATDLKQLVVVPITTSDVISPGPTRIIVAKQTRHGRRMGLTRDSKIVMDNVTTITLKAILKKLGTCGLMDEVDAALKLTLKLL